MTTAFTVDSKNVANKALFIYCICYITPIPMYLAALQKLKTRINKIRLYPVVREKQLFCQEKSQEKTTQSKKAVEKNQDKMIKDALSRKVSRVYYQGFCMPCSLDCRTFYGQPWRLIQVEMLCKPINGTKKWSAAVQKSQQCEKRENHDSQL